MAKPGEAAPAATPARKVARFIAAEAAQSGLKLAEDGKLPELQLKEQREKKSKQAGAGGVNPMILVGAILFSVIASVALILLPTDSTPQENRLQKTEARRRIEEDFFSGMDKGAGLESYQMLLREAQLARSRGQYKEERRLYRKVLDMLRADKGKFDKGLTGSPNRDEKLEELLTKLLSD